MSLQLGYLGGNRIGYVTAQLERPASDSFAINMAYARRGIQIDSGPDLGLNLVRLGTIWTSGRHPDELDARLRGELLIPD